MVRLGEPNPALPTARKRPNNGAPFTQPGKSEYRTSCKACPEGIFTSDKAVWGRGAYLGLLHEACAKRVGAQAMPAATDGRHVAPLPESVARPAEPQSAAVPGGTLTARQAQLLQLLYDGLSVAQIADAQGITAQTVYNLLRNARLRIGGANHDELLDIARQLGLIRRKTRKG